jgi:hypothetical protein
MFTIKVLDELMHGYKSETTYECNDYRVEYHIQGDELDEVLLYLGGAPLCKTINGNISCAPIEIKNVAYVMNSEGKTVDKICSTNFKEGESEFIKKSIMKEMNRMSD